MCDGTPFEEFLADDSPPPSGYMEIDHFMSAFDDLKQAQQALSQLDRKYRWKWAVLGLFQALYGFMICVLEYGNYRNVIDYSQVPKRDKKRLTELDGVDSAEAYAERETIIDKYCRSKRGRLISFRKALERINDPHRPLQYTYSKEIRLSDSERESLAELHDTFRNQFIHFRPTLWLINELVFPPMLLNTVAVIRKVLDSGMLMSFRSDLEDLGENHDSIMATIDEIDDLLKVNQRYVERQQGADAESSGSEGTPPDGGEHS